MKLTTSTIANNYITNSTRQTVLL